MRTRRGGSRERSPWRAHTVLRVGGDAEGLTLPAALQILTRNWNRVVAVPYIIYMPEKHRLLMLVTCDYPHRPMVLSSDDHGATWPPPRYVQRDARERENDPNHQIGVSLTYLGGGRVAFSIESGGRYFSDDYGQTWSDPVPRAPTCDGKPWVQWDPYLVDRDAQTGRITRIWETGYTMDVAAYESGAGPPYSQAHIRFSTDEGRTWRESIKVPPWHGVDEVALLRARNGDIVAACRTNKPKECKEKLDHYEGLAVSVSKDNAQTWSEPNRLYAWGRHHPSMVLLPDGDIVMTYVVRLGYEDTPDGFPQFGVEAVVSGDHGRTWDLDHRYILAKWAGNRKKKNRWWASPQATSSLLLPDGAILTAFDTGFRSRPNKQGLPSPRDVGLITWQVVK